MHIGPSRDADSFISRERRSQLIAATIEVLAEDGFAQTTFARVADRAGVTPGLITYHFGTKHQLMTAVVEHVRTDMERHIERAIEDAGTHGGTLTALIGEYVRYCADKPAHLVAAGHVEDNLAGLTPDDGAAHFEALLREGQAAGEFRTALNTRVAAVALLSALEAAPTELAGRPDSDPTEYAEQLADIFLRGIQRDPQ